MSNKLRRFEHAIAKAIKILLEELIECPNDYEKEDFCKIAKALSKPPEQAMQLLGREIMKINELDPLGEFEDPLLSASLKDSWESVDWGQVATTLARTTLKFLSVASMQLGSARARS